MLSDTFKKKIKKFLNNKQISLELIKLIFTINKDKGFSFVYEEHGLLPYFKKCPTSLKFEKIENSS
jgi:hypothetical protein